MLPIEPATLTAPKWIYRVAIAIFVVYIIYLLQQKELVRKDYGAIVICCIACTICYLYMTRKKLHIDNEGITDYKIFEKTFIGWEEITSADIKLQGTGHGMVPYWILERGDKNSYKIQMPKSRNNFRILAEALIMRAPQAKLQTK